MGKGDGKGDGSSSSSEGELDMKKRDPNSLNPHVQVMFHDVIGEPRGAHSADCVWSNSYKCYNCGKNIGYLILTFVCALPSALCWGCEFACLTFYQIWCVTPFVRCFNMMFVCMARVYSTVIHCCCDPCYESMALIFTQIFHHRVENSRPFNSKDAAELNQMSQA